MRMSGVRRPTLPARPETHRQQRHAKTQPCSRAQPWLKAAAAWVGRLPPGNSQRRPPGTRPANGPNGPASAATAKEPILAI